MQSLLTGSQVTLYRRWAGYSSALLGGPVLPVWQQVDGGTAAVKQVIERFGCCCTVAGAVWCCLAAAGDTLAERAIDGAIGSKYVYTANIPAPRIVSGSRKAVKTASNTGRELSAGVVRPDVTAAATAEELEAIEAAIARLELAAQAKESAAPSLRQRARAATLADSMPVQQKRSAASVSIASVQPAHEAREAAGESAAPDVKDLVAGLQATLASLESAGQDLSSPEVQAVLVRTHLFPHTHRRPRVNNTASG